MLETNILCSKPLTKDEETKNYSKIKSIGIQQKVC